MDKKRKISALILVAGRGKRISNYTNKPKCLLKINKQSLLERNIEFLTSLGINKIFIVVGYKSILIKREIKKLKKKINFVNNKKYITHGNCYSLYLGLKKTNSNVLFFDGDVVYKKKILIDYLNNNITSSILIGKGQENDVECAKVFGTKKYVKRIIEKRIFYKKQHKFLGEAIGINKLNKNDIEHFINLGKEAFKNKKNQSLNWDTFYDLFLLKKLPMKHFFTKEKQWVEIDTYEDFIKAKKIVT